ncbi:MAG: prolyl oligopeptidase family serine peptidase [bacterium]
MQPGARRILIPLFLIIAAALQRPAARAQDQEGGKVLTIEDYSRWRSISGAEISDDGRWVGWTFGLNRADDTLHVALADGDRRHMVPRGSDVAFSDDGRWAAYFISLPWTKQEELREDRERVHREVQLMDLDTGETVTWEKAASFAFSEGSRVLVVHKERTDPEAEHEGADLILRWLEEGTEELVGSVEDAAFNKTGTRLAYTVSAPDEDGNGLYLIELDTGIRRVLDNSEMDYERLNWDEEGTALAVLRGSKPDSVQHAAHALLAYTSADGISPRRHLFDPSEDRDFPEGHIIASYAPLGWNEPSDRVFFGIKEQKEVLPEIEEELAGVDIFHWEDPYLQSVQKKRLSREKRRTYRSVYLLEEERFVRLADEEMRGIQLTRDGRWGIGSDETPYVSDWKLPRADYFRVDVTTGEREPVLEAQHRILGLSPDSRHFLYWKEGHVHVYDIPRDRHILLTASAPVDFADREWDYVGERPPYGVAGWTEDGRHVVLEHRYDLWLQPLDGSAATNLTSGVGGERELVLRYVRTDPEARFIDLSRPVLLSAYGQWTKQEGLFEIREGEIRELVLEDRRFGRPVKAEDSERYLYTVQSFRDFPDLWVSDGGFADRARITEANPQQAEYRWGRSVLVDYTNDDGVRLQGALAVPDGYRDGDRYPMLVMFYEKRSQNHHAYPRPVNRSSPMPAGYVSRGCLVLQPDVHFRTGSSHTDMLECVEAAVREVIDLGYADPARIGLHGHSYSGGGASYIATRSKMFSAIVAGAAPINLAGEFNILFRGSGQNNHRYDIHGQGRYGTDPFSDFELYRQQSPITFVETMDTPLLYLHGDDDQIVEYNQGMEFYNALRFLGKPVIFLSYRGEGHGLRQWENQVDFQHRMLDFYQHHLNGEPAPAWMTEGVSQLERERHLRAYPPER